MFKKLLLTGAIALLLGSQASADPWKDESGHGKWAGGWSGSEPKWDGDFGGEPPWWARGKGYWDGHFKGRSGGPPPWAGGPPPWAGRWERYDRHPEPLSPYASEFYFHGDWQLEPPYYAPPPPHQPGLGPMYFEHQP